MPCPIPAPRKKDAAATRLAMLAAARARFLQESYENVGLRDIAGDVGVDVALVSRYFGSKAELFREVLRDGKDTEDKLPPDLHSEELPRYLASALLSQTSESDRRHAEHSLIILRSASSPQAAEIVREALRGDILLPLAERLGGADADARASLAMAIWMGTTILRTVMQVQPFCDQNCGATQDRLERLFATAFRENCAHNLIA